MCLGCIRYHSLRILRRPLSLGLSKVIFLLPFYLFWCLWIFGSWLVEWWGCSLSPRILLFQLDWVIFPLLWEEGSLHFDRVILHWPIVLISGWEFRFKVIFKYFCIYGYLLPALILYFRPLIHVLHFMFPYRYWLHMLWKTLLIILLLTPLVLLFFLSSSLILFFPAASSSFHLTILSNSYFLMYFLFWFRFIFYFIWGGWIQARFLKVRILLI